MSHLAKLLRAWSSASKLFTEFYAAPYRSTFLQAQAEEDDAFMLLALSETLGIENPAAFYTMELYPILIEEFHQWHTRMGMPRSPMDGFSCC